MPRHWPISTVAETMALLEAGESHREVCQRTGVPIETIRNWRYRRPPLAYSGCPSCGSELHDFTDVPRIAYAYLLGVYLGDGCLCRQGGRCYSLRIGMDLAYPAIINEVADSIEAVRGRRPWVGGGGGKRMRYIVSYWRQWPCWFPQHGPGKKHLRTIALAPWQEAIVERAPGQFLRGLIHSDGWRGLNRVTVKGHSYAYPRYQFSSRSDDIRRLFTDTCDLLGIAWRPWGRWHISVARKDAVTRLDEFVGLKT